MAGPDEFVRPLMEHWWWEAARPCAGEVAWPVGACGLGEYLSPLDLLLATTGCPLGVAAAAVVALNGLALVALARSVGVPPAPALAAGATGLAASALVTTTGSPPGALSAWIATLAILAWWRASTPGNASWLLGAVALTVTGGLADAAWTALASMAALVLARGVGLRYWIAVIGAAVAGHALAAWPFTVQPVAPVEQLVVSGSLSPSWPVALDGPLPLALLVVAGWQGRNGDRVDRAMAWFGLLAWTASLGPRLLGPQGPSEGSHLPLAAWSMVPGLDAFEAPWHFGAGTVIAALLLCARWCRGRRVAALALWVVAWGEGVARHDLPPAGVPFGEPTSAAVDTPAWARALASLPAGAAAVLPLAPELRVFDHGILWARAHRHVLLDAPRAWLAARQPPGWSTTLADESFLAEWARFERGAEDPLDPTRANQFRYEPAQLAGLVGRGLRWWVVVDAHYAPTIRGLGPASRALMVTLAGPATAEGDGWGIWDLGAVASPPAVTAPPWRIPLSPRRGSPTGARPR